MLLGYINLDQWFSIVVLEYLSTAYPPSLPALPHLMSLIRCVHLLENWCLPARDWPDTPALPH